MGIFSSKPSWAIIDGHKYDMTDLLKYHPGGIAIIKNILGKDATGIFRKHHGNKLDESIKKYKIICNSEISS